MTILSKIIENAHMLKITEEFTRLKERCYLDNAGATLYPNNLLYNVNEDLANNVYMNPHTDKYTRDCIEQIRYLVLHHFNTDPSNYTVIFTSGTTQSLKLVVESFQFANENADNDMSECGSFVYLQDNHTSVLGLREIAADKNVDIVHISHNDFMSSLTPEYNSSSYCKEAHKSECNTLFAYPAQSNFNGYKYPIDCIQKIKDGCLNSHIRKYLCKINCNWYVLVDAASFVPTNKLDLSIIQPDFVCLSFYKMFGYPTGLGALLVKNTSAKVLSQKSYFGGGTVDIVLSTEDFHVKRKDIHERFEDGTLPYLSIIALKHCFEALHGLIPAVVRNNIMETIAYHTFYLGKDLYDQLNQLNHSNGNKAAILYMDSDFTDVKKQGSTVTFNILREDGSYVGYAEFQHMADLFNISVRTGCFCNSGSCQRHLNATNKDMKEMFKAGHKCGDEIDLVNGRPTGAVRVSFGYYNTYNDVDKLILMICRCFVKANSTKIKPLRSMKIFKEITNSSMTDKLKTRKDQDYTKKIIMPESQQYIQICDPKATLKEIAIYPIKSCGAFKISAWKIGPKGFEYDREWMIINDSGVCLTQKQNTRMCMIRPKIDLQQKLLILSFKGMASISMSLDVLPENKNKNIKFCQSKICSDLVEIYDCGDEVADWVSEALEISFLRLVRQSTAYNRIKKKPSSSNKLSLSNQAQYLLINEATVRWLKDKIRDQSFTDNITQLTDRFRGNLIIDMEQELVEREWKMLLIGNHEFKVEGLCSRCQMVCIDQQTGEKTVEPLRTIAEEFAGKIKFGIYLTHIGPVNTSTDNILKTNVQVHPVMLDDDDISRFKNFLLKKFLNKYSHLWKGYDYLQNKKKG